MLSRRLFVYSHEALQGIEVCFQIQKRRGRRGILTWSWLLFLLLAREDWTCHSGLRVIKLYSIRSSTYLDIPPNVLGICWRETTFFSETFRFNFVVLADCKGSLSPSHCL